MIFNLYSKYKSGYFYAKQQKQLKLSEAELDALKNLSNKPSIVICKPDKGNGVVLLDKSTYQQKMENILKDKSKFKLATNNNLKQLQKFQNFLARLKKSGAINQEVYHRIRPTATSIPTLYGLPKTHKDNIPLRPILSSTGSYNHECATWLSEILTPLRDHPSSLKDTYI